MKPGLTCAGRDATITLLHQGMGDRFADLTVIRRLLNDTTTWAFVGLSGDPGRTVYNQAKLMKERGKKIIPVHPDGRPVLGETTYRTLAEVPIPIDVVGVYRRTAFAIGVIDEAIAIGAGAVWLPLDVYDEAAGDRALAAGLDVVMNRCPAVEWALRR
ncbi:CoA-binding protein [Herbidospora sp. RD11066]